MFKSIYKLVILVVLALPFVTNAQSEKEQTMLWRVSGKGLEGRSYLFGTFPAKDSAFFRFPNSFWKFFDQTDVVVIHDDLGRTRTNDLRTASFKNLDNYYQVLPDEYIGQIANQRAKPVIYLDSKLNYHHTTSSIAEGDMRKLIADAEQNGSGYLIDELKRNYLSGRFEELSRIRKKLDVPETVYYRYVGENNYAILSDLVAKMQLQPSLIALDAIHLGGQEGLISLLRARGFTLKPIDVPFYKQMEAMLSVQWQPVVTAEGEPTKRPLRPTAGNRENVNSGTEDTADLTPVSLDLPMDLMNLEQWSTYYYYDSTLYFMLPGKPKQAEVRNEETYNYNYGGLEYSVAVKYLDDDTGKISDEVERLMIRNGGQLVLNKNATVNGLKANNIELVYRENILSKHTLIRAGDYQYTASVKGPAPQIFTPMASAFLNSFTVISYNETESDLGALPEIAAAPVWTVVSQRNLSLNLPDRAEEFTEKMDDGASIQAYKIARSPGGNAYVVAISQTKVADKFRLFNTSINKGLTHIGGVIENSTVLPVEKPYFAEYEVRDALDNRYRMIYLTDGSYFYQVLVKGSKKSVRNSEANTVVNSIIFNFLP